MKAVTSPGVGDVKVEDARADSWRRAPSWATSS